MDKNKQRLIQQVYLRICKDSNYRIDYVNAAIFTGNIVKVHPLEVWIAMGSFDYMERATKGEQFTPISAG